MKKQYLKPSSSTIDVVADNIIATSITKSAVSITDDNIDEFEIRTNENFDVWKE